MARDLGGNATALAERYKRPAFFVELVCASGYIQVWSGRGSMTALSRTFQGVGALGGISGLPETGELTPEKVTLTLSGIPSTLVALALDRTEYRQRPVRIWRGFMNSGWTNVVSAPNLRWAGRMDTMVGRLNGPGGVITVTCESDLVQLRRPREIRMTHEAQQARFPGDRYAEYISTVAQAPIYWGGPGPSQPGGYGK